MKLRNIIIALGAVVAFSACSKDDGNDPNGNAPVKLNVKVVAKTAKSKADPLELTGEANINTLTAVVFDPTTGLTTNTMSVAPGVSHEYTMAGIPSHVGVAQVVLIANAPESVARVTTYAELEGLLAELGNQAQGNLTMSTPLLTTANLAKGTHDLGELVLTRLAARIEIGNVKTDFTKPLLRGRRVMINNVSLDNVKTKSRFFSVADWGQVEVSGNYMSSSAKLFTEYTPLTDLGYAAYVMENLGSETGKTTVVIEATLEENGQLPPIRQTFRAVINANGRLQGYDHNYIKRNYVYNLGITFSDNSFDPNTPPTPPDPGFEPQLDVQITVVPWGQVEQDVDMED